MVSYYAKLIIPRHHHQNDRNLWKITNSGIVWVSFAAENMLRAANLSAKI